MTDASIFYPSDPRTVLVVLGNPCAGLTLFSNCLKFLGLKSPDDHTIVPVINAMLLQELGVPKDVVMPLPDGWYHSHAAEKARKRIDKLLKSLKLTSNQYFFSDSQFCRVLPLWLKSFEEYGIVPHCTFLIRHPWEVALSFAINHNFEMDDAHILWLSYVCSALKTLKDLDYSVITYDQLLSDPINTLLRSQKQPVFYTRNNYESILNFVQPKLKKYHTCALPELKKTKFKAYDRLYNQIRTGCDNPFNEQEASSNLNLSILLDSLLSTLGKHQKRAADMKKSVLEKINFSSEIFFAQIVFPSSGEKQEIIETFPLCEEQWEKITMTVPEPELLKDNPIIFKPLNRNGTVMISAINLINMAKGEPVFALKTKEDFDLITLQGSVLRIPNSTALTLMITGDGSCISLNSINLVDCPMQFEVWIKITRKQEIKKFVESIKEEIKQEIHADIIKSYKNPYVHNRILTLEMNRRIIEFAEIHLKLTGLKPNYIYYLANKTTQIELNCVGRLATTTQDAIVRQLVAESISEKNICIVEIGSLYGISLAILYNHVSTRFENAHIAGIDPLNGFYGKAVADAVLNIPISDSIFKRNMQLAYIPDNDYSLIKHYSFEPQALAAAEKLQFNLLIIDGDHSYEGVKFDFDTYFPLLQPGGFVIFDDYNTEEWPGVKKFIDEDIGKYQDFLYLGSIFRTAIGCKKNNHDSIASDLSAP